MFKALRNWINDDEPSEAELERARAEEAERRLDTRYEFSGHKIVIRDRRVSSVLGLKDLSCRGACGLSEMPLSVGALVFIEIRKRRFHAAEVRWVRNALIGLRFYRPLEPDMVEKFHATHLAKKSRPVLRAGAR